MRALPKSIPAIYPPTIVKTELGRFAVFVSSTTNHWYPVDEQFTHEDAIRHWVKENQTQVAPPTKTKTSGEAKSWQVESSKKNGYYTVQRISNSWSCTCPSFGFRRTCKHIKEIQTKLKEN